MELLVIDGQGGGIGKSIIDAVKKAYPQIFIIAVGTNSAATQNGIAFGNSMYGEISPAMAQAVSCSEAQKYFIPVSQCNGHVLGIETKTIQGYIQDFIQILK